MTHPPEVVTLSPVHRGGANAFHGGVDGPNDLYRRIEVLALSWDSGWVYSAGLGMARRETTSTAHASAPGLLHASGSSGYPAGIHAWRREPPNKTPTVSASRNGRCLIGRLAIPAQAVGTVWATGWGVADRSTTTARDFSSTLCGSRTYLRAAPRSKSL